MICGRCLSAIEINFVAVTLYIIEFMGYQKNQSKQIGLKSIICSIQKPVKQQSPIYQKSKLTKKSKKKIKSNIKEIYKN